MNKGMDFGEALKAMKHGQAVTRTSWNAGGQFAYLVGPGRYLPTTDVGNVIALAHVDRRVPYRGYMALCTAQGDVVPWTPTQSDCLAEDWEVTP